MPFPPLDPPMAYSILAGREVSTWSEEWKHECEIAYLAAMPIAKLANALDGTPAEGERNIKQIRGERAVAVLRSEIERYIALKRGVPPAPASEAPPWN